MIYRTPEISDDVRKYLQSENYQSKSVLEFYSGFQDSFVWLHPFLKVKEGCAGQIRFETGNWPDKIAIGTYCEKISWNEVIRLTDMRDIKSLDVSLAFYHRASRFAERKEYAKFKQLIEKERVDIIPPQVDKLPEIDENRLLKKLQSLGYNSVFIYSDIQSKGQLTSIEEILSDRNGLPFHVRMETPDSQILVVQDFDQRFTCLLSNKTLLLDMVESLDLEGFFCDQDTPQSWSYYNIPDTEKMDWDEDMKATN